ncbi:MAG: Maf family protein [Desulfomicrobium escambiense]|nr:Maf family protein [Desulfomicrobium escambiense]
MRTLARPKAGDIADSHPGKLGDRGRHRRGGRGPDPRASPHRRPRPRDMLRRLSGRTHQVLTGYCICRRADGQPACGHGENRRAFQDAHRGGDRLVHPDRRALRQGRRLRHPGHRHLPGEAHQRLLHQRGRAAGVRGDRTPHPPGGRRLRFGRTRKRPAGKTPHDRDHRDTPRTRPGAHPAPQRRPAAGRSSDVNLVAVTKTFPPEAIREAVAGGAADIGENYIQEARDKFEPLQRHSVRPGTSSATSRATRPATPCACST